MATRTPSSGFGSLRDWRSDGRIGHGGVLRPQAEAGEEGENQGEFRHRGGKLGADGGFWKPQDEPADFRR